MKHTPGQWKVDIVTGAIIGVCVEQKVEGGIYSHAICEAIWSTASEYKKNKDQIKADMTLIAAAPTMYEVLNDCIETMNILLMELHKDDVILRHEVQSRKDQIEKTINIATT
jgi:hypothetical protein